MGIVKFNFSCLLCALLLTVGLAKVNIVRPNSHNQKGVGTHRQENELDPSTEKTEVSVETSPRPHDTVPVLSDFLPSDKIYNGRPVGNSFSFYVTFVTYNASILANEKEYTLLCSGTMIDRKSILTAAHCAVSIKLAITDGYGVEAWLGVNDLRVIPRDGQRRNILVRNLQWNNKFSVEKHYKNDIAVINVEPFTAQYSSICFTKNNYEGKEVTLIGFGIPACNSADYSRVLLKAEGQIYLGKTCNEMGLAYPLTKSQACVVPKNRTGEKPTQFSPGDIGGPIFYSSDLGDGSMVQVGVVSVNRKRKSARLGQCVEEAYIGLYTRPDRYKSFIQKWAPMSKFNC